MLHRRAKTPERGSGPRRSFAPVAFVARGTPPTRLLLFLPLILGTLLLVVAATQWGSSGHPGVIGPIRDAPAPLYVASGPAATRSPGTPGPIVQLQLNATPGAICENGLSDCPASAGEATVTMTEQAGIKGHNDWPRVQVVFLLETTPYDGVYDPSAGVPGADPCGDTEVGSSALCDESNGVPFFVANAGAIVGAVQNAHPNSSFSFALVDYFATHDRWDDGDGAVYHMDVAKFVNATDFGPAVVRTFQQTLLGGGFIVPHSDLADNFLHSSSITALYATLSGWNGINWSATAHHVIVQLGSTAPRDPNYPENYCVSPAVTPKGLGNCTSPICEPPVIYLQNISPACEGWVQAHDQNKSHSIAALAHQSDSCVNSLGGNCTIDEVNYNDTPTNPHSPSWSAAGGSGGPTNWTADATSIVQSGCDLASATNGTWAGPTWFTCASLHTRGSLSYVPLGAPAQPNTGNPRLMAALTHFGLGTLANPVVAAGASVPLYLFVPWGNFLPALLPNWNVICTNSTGAKMGCPASPTVQNVLGTPTFGWNWSNDPVRNVMHLGDTWRATFNVRSGAPPYGLQPVDACLTRACLAAGSDSVGPAFTSTTFQEYGSQTVITYSYPLAQVALEPLTVYAVPVPPSPGALPGAPPSNPAPSTIAPAPATPASPIPASMVPMEAAASGFIAAGFIRLGVRRPGVSQKQGSLTGPMAKAGRYTPRPGPVGHWT